MTLTGHQFLRIVPLSLRQAFCLSFSFGASSSPPAQTLFSAVGLLEKVDVHKLLVGNRQRQEHHSVHYRLTPQWHVRSIRELNNNPAVEEECVPMCTKLIC